MSTTELVLRTGLDSAIHLDGKPSRTVECRRSAAHDGTFNKRSVLRLTGFAKKNTEESASILGRDLADLVPLTPGNRPFSEVGAHMPRKCSWCTPPSLFLLESGKSGSSSAFAMRRYWLLNSVGSLGMWKVTLSTQR